MARLEDQDNELIQLKEDNLILRNQKQQLIDCIKNENNNKFKSLLVKSPRKDRSVLGGLDIDDPADIRIQVQALHNQLIEQRDQNAHLKSYVDEILMNIMMKNPEILEKN
eukprot:TRINITY_DN15046_c0_g1_i1.p1 TRINITY_DN15046_c0_g1~~TRINITY_DN15046_c0_g1_i1.p1  ORF type:complete len:110 (-),score=24.07 TRINITY_DN15046_c0_g1_i1:71-400(-)